MKNLKKQIHNVNLLQIFVEAALLISLTMIFYKNWHWAAIKNIGEVVLLSFGAGFTLCSILDNKRTLNWIDCAESWKKASDKWKENSEKWKEQSYKYQFISEGWKNLALKTAPEKVKEMIKTMELNEKERISKLN